MSPGIYDPFETHLYVCVTKCEHEETCIFKTPHEPSFAIMPMCGKCKREVIKDDSDNLPKHQMH